MPIHSVFLDWNNPALPSTAEYLCQRYASGGMLDLQQTIIALPGGRAGRRLLEILVDQAEERQLAFVPPKIVTAGQLPELLYDAKWPFANTLTQQLAWVEALRNTDERALTCLTHQLPADHDLFAWLGLGELLATLHRELAGEGLTFGDVATRSQTLATFNESERWHVLSAIQSRYLQVLQANDLSDQQTARLQAIDETAFWTDGDIILVDTVDLNATQRAMLDQVADRVTALIFAPLALANQFDAHGCVVAQAWQDARIDLDAVDITFVDSANEQADTVVRALASVNEGFTADDITIGIPDTRIVPYVQQRLEEYGVPFRYGLGTPSTHTSPCRLLRAIADFLDSDSFTAFANLVRHPAIDQWLATQGIAGNWLTELDDYYETHLPARMNGQWLPERQPRDALHQAFTALEHLIAHLQHDVRYPHQWTEAILALLLEVYGQFALDSEDEAQRAILVTCEQIQQAAHEQLYVREPIAPRISGAAALRLVLRVLEDTTIPPRFDHVAVEFLGWLELPLDDAPVVIVTGFNEGCISPSQNGDLFLPDTLRDHLGLQDNARRYARDAYNLAMLAASRSHVTLISGRRTPDNDVLLPSRLLFSCDEDRLLLRTLEAFSPPHPDRRRGNRLTPLKPGRAQASFTIPRPVPLSASVTSMRVTEFRDYLECPYRYYLRHHLNLQTIDTTAEELGPGDFGELLHEALRAFAIGPASGSHRAVEIRDALHSSLDDIVRQSFGDEPLPAVCVQIEQARWRLDRFAAWQAEWVSQGWRIEHAEPSVGGEQSWLLIDGEPMYLRGRIDRIDCHETTRERIIFDYKTGDTAREPDAVHRTRQQEWVDLQLPLYRHVVRGLGIEEDVRLGYILMPKALNEIGPRVAPWSQEDLAHADVIAGEVVRNVRAERFWPPASGPVSFDDFAAICQTTSLATHALEDEG